MPHWVSVRFCFLIPYTTLVKVHVNCQTHTNLHLLVLMQAMYGYAWFGWELILGIFSAIFEYSDAM